MTTTWKKAISVTASAGLLASLLATAAVGTVSASTGPFGTAYPYSTNVDERPADGTSYIEMDFTTGTVPATTTLVQISVTGGQFIGGTSTFAPSAALTYPRTSYLQSTTPPAVPVIAAGAQLWLASSTVGTATVTVNYSTGTTVYDSSASFTFTSATVNVPSTALSTSKVYKAGVSQPNPASAPKGTTATTLYMAAQVKNENGEFPTSGVTVEWTISGPAYFDCANGVTGGTGATTTTAPTAFAAACGAATYKATATVSSANGWAASPQINSTGAGGTATITSTVKYLGVSYTLPDKTINFVGDPAKIVISNGYYSIATDSSQGPQSLNGDGTAVVSGVGDGAIEAALTDANGFQITSGVTFTATSITPSAFWTIGFDSPQTGSGYYDNDEKLWDIGVACGGTAGTASANIKATVGTKSVTSTDAITLTCADPLTTVDLGTLTVSTAATTVPINSQLEVSVTVKDVNGLPAPDSTTVTAATNGVGTVVRAKTGLPTSPTSNGIAKFIYLSPPNVGTAVVTFFVPNTVQKNVSVTLGVGTSAAQPIPVATALNVTTTGPFGVATLVPKVGQYITLRGLGGASFAGQKVGIYWASKNSSGVWSAFTLVTSRIADATGTIFYYYKSPSAAWLSFRFGPPTAGGTFFSVARQSHWQ